MKAKTVVQAATKAGKAAKAVSGKASAKAAAEKKSRKQARPSAKKKPSQKRAGKSSEVMKLRLELQQVRANALSLASKFVALDAVKDVPDRATDLFLAISDDVIAALGSDGVRVLADFIAVELSSRLIERYVESVTKNAMREATSQLSVAS